MQPNSQLLETALLILAPSLLIIVGMFLTLKTMSRNLEKTLRSEIIRQNNQDFVKLKLAAYERLALLLERTSIPALIQKFAKSGTRAAEVSQLMLISINEEFNFNISQQVFVSQQTWGTIKIVKEQSIMLIQQVERALPPETNGADYCVALIEAMKQNGEVPHEKGLQMIRGEMELLFN
jgi:hypothetical protein